MAALTQAQSIGDAEVHPKRGEASLLLLTRQAARHFALNRKCGQSENAQTHMKTTRWDDADNHRIGTLHIGA